MNTTTYYMNLSVSTLLDSLELEKKIINGDTYFVKPSEFEKQDSDYKNLHIANSLGEMESICGFLHECYEQLSPIISHWTFYNCSHGGYIPCQIIRNGNTKQLTSQSHFHLLQMDKTTTIAFINNQPTINSDSITISFTPPVNNTPQCIFYSNIHNNPYLHELPNSIHIVKCDDSNGLLLEPVNNITIFDIYWLSNQQYLVYVPKIHSCLFRSIFSYWMDSETTMEIKYDNLIHLCVMVKNGGNEFETMLRKNLPIIDYWTIVDTGSTDNTVEMVRSVLKSKKGELIEEPFINFRDSRNRCLDLAGTRCKYTIMLDDTYVIDGDLRGFLRTIRGDQFGTSYTLSIHSDDSQYTSNRIVKTKCKLRYIYKLHEVIQIKDNINVIIPYEQSRIIDIRSPYMEKRTMERKLYDLQILQEEYDENPDDPRNLYYIAQTYNLLGQSEKAVEYFIKRATHWNKGFVQEIYDAYFEAGRISQYTLGKSWEECLFYYESARIIDPNRPEIDYFVGIYHYLQGNMEVAYNYFQKGFAIGFPIHSEMSLKPTLSYFYLPKFLVILCYQFHNYQLGKEVAFYFLQHNTDTTTIEYNMMIQWVRIYSHLLSMTSEFVMATTYDKPVFCFVADGGFSEWTGRDIEKHGMGGSETYIVEMAREIQRIGIFQVIVFCRCTEMDVYDSVVYYPITTFSSYIAKNAVHTVFISRYAEYIPVSVRCTNVENVYIVFHDVIQSEMILPIDDKLRKIYCLSEWHRQQFVSLYPSFSNKTGISSYGLSFLPNDAIIKVKHRFIYSSFPNRGLLQLLQMWATIIHEIPDASLHIYCDLHGKWVNSCIPTEMQEIRTIIASFPTTYNVTVFGWVNKATLYNAWLEADIWFYPTSFCETYCLTALECALSRTLAVTMKIGALQNTVSNRGILLEGDPKSDIWKQNACTFITQLLSEPLNNSNLQTQLVNSNYEWALQQTWLHKATELLEDILSNNIVKLNFGIKSSKE